MSYWLKLESTPPNFGRPVSTQCGHFQVRGSDLQYEKIVLKKLLSDID